MNENYHDRTYTVLATILAFFFLVGIGVNIFVVGTEGIMRFVMYVEALLALLCILTVIFRIKRTETGVILTKALNIILLIYFPFGTALAVYGFLKVDKQTTKKKENKDLQPEA